MKKSLVILGIVALLAACTGGGRKEVRLAIDDPAGLLGTQGRLIGQVFEDADYKIIIVPPDPSIDYKILRVAPDPDIDYKLIIEDPRNGRETPVPEIIIERFSPLIGKPSAPAE